MKVRQQVQSTLQELVWNEKQGRYVLVDCYPTLTGKYIEIRPGQVRVTWPAVRSFWHPAQHIR